jgi:hypothetical protein
MLSHEVIDVTFIEPEDSPSKDFGIDATFLEYKQELLRHIASTRRFLGNAGKLVQEKSVVRALLRSLGISFSESALCTSEVEPVDVTFGEARFQIKTSWDGYRPQLSWKDIERRINAARSWSDLLEPVEPSESIDQTTLISKVTSQLQQLGSKYGKGRSKLDALLYINNRGRHPTISSPLPDVSPLKEQGWRSVSVVFPPVGIVLVAEVAAPVFLHEMVGRVRAEWPNIETLFDP